MMDRVKALAAEYGPIAVVVYLMIFASTLGGFTLAIRAGFQPEGAVAGAGTLTGAYVATKVTQPLRIAATAVLTPIAARIWSKVRPVRTPDP